MEMAKEMKNTREMLSKIKTIDRKHKANVQYIWFYMNNARRMITSVNL